MYSLIKYFTRSKTTKEEQNETQKPKLKVSKKQEIKNHSHKSIKVYLVVEKNTQNPLGIFDNFEMAKQNGQKTTHHNCMIIPFTINDSCKYLFNTVFEDV